MPNPGRTVKRALIAAAREAVDPDEMIAWLLEVARGYEPRPFGEEEAGVVDVGPRARVPLEASMAAWKMLREITFGVPAQAEYVDRMWREHEAARADDQVDPRALTDDELEALAEADARVLEIHERAASRPRGTFAEAVAPRRALPPPPRAPAPARASAPPVGAHPAAAFLRDQAPAAAPTIPTRAEAATSADGVRVHMFAGSTAVSALRFDPRDGTCVVTFPGGARFKYGGFTARLVDEWLRAPSPGGWFHARIRRHVERHPVLEKHGEALAEVRTLEVL